MLARGQSQSQRKYKGMNSLRQSEPLVLLKSAEESDLLNFYVFYALTQLTHSHTKGTWSSSYRKMRNWCQLWLQQNRCHAHRYRRIDLLLIYPSLLQGSGPGSLDLDFLDEIVCEWHGCPVYFSLAKILMAKGFLFFFSSFSSFGFLLWFFFQLEIFLGDKDLRI